MVAVLLAASLLPACAPAGSTPLPPTATASIAATSAAAAPRVLVVTPQATRLATPPPGPSAASLDLPPASGTEWVSPVDSATLVFVAGGEFNMGTTEDEPAAEPDEFPLHVVSVRAFWIDRDEVTTRRYALCVEAGACTAPPSAFSAEFDVEYYGSEAYAEYPVVNVTWQQASTYCTWAGRRLPTEAEWEKAARGRPGKTFPWGWFGQVTNDRLNYCDAQCPYVWHDTERDDGYRLTSPAGAYPKGASPYGALDMAGNVWEWVADWYGATYYADSPRQDPTGPESGTVRVLRGGSWLDGLLAKRFAFARTANRYWHDPDLARSYIGFRCAADAGD
jgi:formylglycine-generating enzyme required for sulfatase activity